MGTADDHSAPQDCLLIDVRFRFGSLKRFNIWLGSPAWWSSLSA